MTPALVALALLGVIGGGDSLYYHVDRCRLFSHPQCALENLHHAGHSLSFAVFAVALLVEARGDWWWAYPLACLGQTVNQVADVMIEPDSRDGVGGVPPGEYRLHGLIGLLWGALMVDVLVGSAPLHLEPTALAWRPHPWPVTAALWASIPPCLMFAVFDGLAGIRGLFARARS